jgi:hypothetical protein
MVNAELMLDPNIRDWVLLPIVAVMVMVGIGRSMVQVLLKSDMPADVNITKHRMLLTRSSKIRMNGGILPPRSFQLRKVCLGGYLHILLPTSCFNKSPGLLDTFSTEQGPVRISLLGSLFDNIFTDL